MTEAGSGSAEDRGQPSTHDTGSQQGTELLATRLSELARDLQRTRDEPHETLVTVVQAAAAMIPGVEGGSISAVSGRRRVTSEAASGELPAVIDAAQNETGEGPCLDAVYEHQTVRVPDLHADRRWPEFARRAVAAGAGSMLVFQLYVEGDNLGALNLFSTERNAFDDESEHVGLLLASHAAVALAGAQRQSQLLQTIDSRDLIGQAKGILMERFHVTSDQAFLLLVRVSQSTHLKLRDVAEQLARSGSMPETTEGASRQSEERYRTASPEK